MFLLFLKQALLIESDFSNIQWVNSNNQVRATNIILEKNTALRAGKQKVDDIENLILKYCLYPKMYTSESETNDRIQSIGFMCLCVMFPPSTPPLPNKEFCPPI